MYTAPVLEANEEAVSKCCDPCNKTDSHCCERPGAECPTHSAKNAEWMALCESDKNIPTFRNV